MDVLNDDLDKTSIKQLQVAFPSWINTAKSVKKNVKKRAYLTSSFVLNAINYTVLLSLNFV